MRRAALALLACLPCLAATAARADGEMLSKMTPADKAKLAAYETTRAQALSEARAGGSPADLAELDKALAGQPLNTQDMKLDGEWSCRVIKLGKGVPIVIYPWFKCRAKEDDYSVRLSKLTGSQRTSGYFYSDDVPTRAIYLGALHYADEAEKNYGRGDPARNQVAYAFWTSKDYFRLEFTAPEYESLMDVMELRRR